ncbi:MAG: phosphoribosylanthranilate isomerase, partial [Cyclobacteriaceae bacterium]|nr:phosphoribosylanthranilate isomerase [Cyclobacteriaceae bacterium]
MAGIKWKVCGLRDNIGDVVTLHPDYIGFIFYKKSPRYVGEDFLMPGIDQLDIKKVGVFVNESMDFVFNTCIKYKLNYAQLHGNEPPEYCEALHKKEIKIIKAFQVGEDFDLLKPYESTIEFFLFDTKTKHYGGSGTTFDWSILKKYSLGKKYFLSGGLSPDNIGDLKNLDLSKIEAIDVNSKIEIS